MEIQKFLSRLEKVKQTGNKWQARCPAHDDHQSSLAVSTGDDGRILVKCFAGCTTEDIVRALGIGLKDLFPDSKSGGEGGEENAEEKEAIHFIYDRAGAEACLGNLDSVEFFAVMQDMNMKHQKIDEMKLMDFFQGYEMKMLGGDQ